MTVVDFEKFVEELADVSGEAIMPFFRTAIAADDKAHGGAFDPVTEADRAAELAMRRLIQRTFPNHGIIGEEFASREEGAEYVWVLDPIDGTKSFITGMPLFGTLIAFVEDGVPRLGIIEMPALCERWSASRGVTAFGGNPCRVSGCLAIEDARIYTASPDIFSPADWEAYDRLSRRAAIRRFGGDCYQYGLLASGHCDLVVEASLMPYDFMALVPVVEGAGGRITDWEGRPLGLHSDGRVVASASAALHDRALRELAGTA